MTQGTRTDRVLSFRVPRELADAAKVLARHRGVTVNALLAGMYAKRLAEVQGACEHPRMVEHHCGNCGLPAGECR